MVQSPLLTFYTEQGSALTSGASFIEDWVGFMAKESSPSHPTAIVLLPRDTGHRGLRRAAAKGAILDYAKKPNSLAPLSQNWWPSEWQYWKRATVAFTSSKTSTSSTRMTLRWLKTSACCWPTWLPTVRILSLSSPWQEGKEPQSLFSNPRDFPFTHSKQKWHLRTLSGWWAGILSLTPSLLHCRGDPARAGVWRHQGPSPCDPGALYF